MKTLATMLLTLTLACGLASAQLTLTPQATVHLPYPVQIGSVVAPAGDYTIRVLQITGGNPVLEISSASGFSVSVLANRVPDLPPSAENGDVVLSRNDDTYRLDKIWMNGAGFALLDVSAK